MDDHCVMRLTNFTSSRFLGRQLSLFTLALFAGACGDGGGASGEPSPGELSGGRDGNAAADSPGSSVGGGASSDGDSDGGGSPGSGAGAASGGSDAASGTGGEESVVTRPEPPGPSTSACDTDSVVVDSLEELVPYFSQDNVKVQLAPGVYRVSTSDTDSLVPDPTLFSIPASGSTYCFTGATIEFETELFLEYADDVVEVYLSGSNTILKNLTIEDIGDSRPYKTALGVKVEGSSNTLDGLHLTVRGSEPYGYGDLFGKGTGYVIKHHKHSALLVRGTDTVIRDSTIIHRAYGHAIYMQGAVNTLIEGCYIEGETRTTDEVLAEEGTDAAAENFMTVWGYAVPPGYTFSLQEDGIRAYNSGNGFPEGTRQTEGIRVLDSTVINMRSGVAVSVANGERYVEGSTMLGCEKGYSMGSGSHIVASSGDAIHGPLYVDRTENSNNNVELTVLDNSARYGNHTALAYIGGRGHDLSFKSADGSVTSDLEIMFGGLRPEMRFLGELDPNTSDHDATDMNIDNQTGYPIVLSPKASNILGASLGEVFDEGSDNAIVSSTP